MPDWFEVHSVPPVLDDRLNHLGAGEREAIVLAELLGTVLVMDELDGWLEARRRELPVTGLIGALLDAGERGLLEIPETFKKLQETTFRLSPTLVKRLLGRR
ncbi:MAG TPA: hypothetical protein VKT81_10110 [Bryobacteraceae bacterium]|nr:hypothetical protein [Bryobacteraceae bacterium]